MYFWSQGEGKRLNGKECKNRCKKAHIKGNGLYEKEGSLLLNPGKEKIPNRKNKRGNRRGNGRKTQMAVT